MPKLSSFYGIQISMWPDEHGIAHFHASHGGRKASISIGTLEVLGGGIQPRALVMVRDWASAHRAELQAAWDALRAGKAPNKIEPLE